MPKYIHEHKGYPKFTWDKDALLNLLTRVSVLQGKVLGKMQQFGFDVQQEAMLNALTEEITKSSEIEGEILNSEQVRSSLAKWLNINLEKETRPSHHIEGIVEAVMDAVHNYNKSLNEERLKISQPTAIRMLNDLVKKGFLAVRGAGRGTHYVLENLSFFPRI